MDFEKQQQQQQRLPTPPPPLATVDAYPGYDAPTNNAPVVFSEPQSQQTMTTTATTFGATYVNIGVLPPAGGGCMTNTAISPGTSTFKTPLLPMPTLEDIEGGAGLSSLGMGSASSNSTGSSHVSGSTATPQPIPGGILKYPLQTACSSNSGSSGSSGGGSSMLMSSMNLAPLGPGPPPPTSMHTIISTTVMPSTQAYPAPPPHTLGGIITVMPLPITTTTTTQLQQQQQQQQHQQQHQLPPTTLALNNDAAMCGTLKSNAKLLQMSTTASSLTAASGTSITVAALLGSSASGGSGGAAGVNMSNKTPSTSKRSSINVQQKPASKCCCCACFGSRQTTTTTTTTTTSKSKKHKRKTQTFWSAVLTNLGICALLLAYTLLGSFIFLTIESEDSSSALLQHQRILASTKRVQGHGGYSGASGSSSSHIYHNTPQTQMTARLDNGTNSRGGSATSSSSSSASVHSTPLEGVFVPLNGDTNNNNNNNNDNNEFIYGDDATPQLALSAETYDVRQRTIENIWDITVSLNILYKENWTKLAALEIAKFQDQLIKRLNEDTLLQLTHEMDGASPATEAVLLHSHHHGVYEWNFAKAFLYSLTVLTTIGYGNIAPRTTLGRLVTLAYAIFGIPLTLVYLSSTGGILAKVAREVFSKALCCCLCSKCGYCCYDEKRMAEKERRMKRKRQQEELRKQQAAMQEPYYVRSGSLHDGYQTPPEKQTSATSAVPPVDIDSLSASESRGSMHGLSILAPILLCLCMMVVYIIFGAVVLYRLEDWPLLDGVYFCFMSLSTIGFGDMLPGLRRESTTTTWFCSIYIMSGMALTAMCFNVIHEEIVHRIKIVVEFKKGATLDSMNDEHGYNCYMPS